MWNESNNNILLNVKYFQNVLWVRKQFSTQVKVKMKVVLQTENNGHWYQGKYFIVFDLLMSLL